MERPRRVCRHASRNAANSVESRISSTLARRTTSKSSLKMLGLTTAGDAFRFSISLYLRQASDCELYRQKLRVVPQVFPSCTYHASTYTQFHLKDPKKDALCQNYPIRRRHGTFNVPISCSLYFDAPSQTHKLHCTLP